MRFIYFIISGAFFTLFFIAYYNFRRKRIGVQSFVGRSRYAAEKKLK